MSKIVLPNVPMAVRAGLLYQVINDRTIHVLAAEPVECGACRALRQMVTVRHVAGGWTVECVRCDRAEADERGLEKLDRLKLETTLVGRKG